MMEYITLKEQQQEQVNNFPMMFAFSNEQLDRGCEKLGVKDAEKELYSIGAGGYIRKTDSEKFNALMDSLAAEMAEAITNYDFLLDALIYELGNHEYCITVDPGPALNALGLSREDVQESGQLHRALDAAIHATIGGLSNEGY